ncbi:hypothetical protein [Afipia sp. DC4300-2b1]|uniref:hypothetical protein n=1 Tax=Afipia sp. DC4300-2b1 TaxID=2804672 RepID=UPI003CFA64B7
MAIVIKRADGGVSVMTLLGDALEAANSAPDHLETIVQAEIAQWQKEDRADVVSWRVIPDEEIPTDKTFRAAWRDETPDLRIDLDMDRCREIWKNKMRGSRARKLAALDVDVVRAIESGQSTAELAQKKQALRDVTKHPALAAARTPEDLKQVWPDILNSP